MNQRFYILLTIPLLCFYLTIFYAAFDPDVSEPYQKYYIDQTSTISPTELKFLKPYQPGEWIDVTANNAWGDFSESSTLLFDGWSHPESDFRWSNGKEVALVFMTPYGDEIRGEIEFEAFYLNQQRVELLLNNHKVGSFLGEGEDDVRSIAFNPRFLKDKGLNRLVFKLPDARSPRFTERRRLAIAMKKLRIR